MDLRKEQKSLAEKRQTVLFAAIRLREKREDSKIRQENARQRQAVLQRQYLITLEKKQLVRNILNQSRIERYNRLKQDLKEETTHWISKDLIASKIKVELFLQPCSTGENNKLNFCI